MCSHCSFGLKTKCCDIFGQPEAITMIENLLELIYIVWKKSSTVLTTPPSDSQAATIWLFMLI